MPAIAALAAAGHAHVDDGEVGLVDVRGVRGVVATRDGSHDAEPAVRLEQLLDRSADDDLVVGQQHSDHGSVPSPAPASARFSRACQQGAR